MKQLNTKKILLGVSLTVLTLTGVYLFSSYAQSPGKDGDKKEKKSGSIKVVTVLNGDTTVHEENFSDKDFNEADFKLAMDSLEKVLKDLDINFNMNLNGKSFSFQNGSGNGKTIVKSFNFDDEITNLDSMLKNLDMNFDIQISNNKDGKGICKKIIINAGNEGGNVSVNTFALDCDGKDGEKAEAKTTAKSQPGKTVTTTTTTTTGDDGKLISKKITIKISDAEELTKTSKKKDASKNKSTEEPASKLDVKDLNLYPNPNTGDFNLSFSLKEKGDAVITMTDMSGKEVFREMIEGFSGTYEKKISLEGKATGIYFLKVEQNGKQVIKKIVKEE